MLLLLLDELGDWLAVWAALAAFRVVLLIVFLLSSKCVDAILLRENELLHLLVGGLYPIGDAGRKFEGL